MQKKILTKNRITFGMKWLDYDIFNRASQKLPMVGMNNGTGPVLGQRQR
jgi:hypothetical protein